MEHFGGVPKRIDLLFQLVISLSLSLSLSLSFSLSVLSRYTARWTKRARVVDFTDLDDDYDDQLCKMRLITGSSLFLGVDWKGKRLLSCTAVATAAAD